MRSLKFGWLIPVAILFVISFPPLFGHEIVAVLCGNVWGLWEGFGIVALGTLIGEVGNFYAFRYMCRARAEKLERDVWWYACLARTVREGGFIIAIVARLSAIPGHFTTAVFATAGMNIFVFLVAAILSSPKQFATVYVGGMLSHVSPIFLDADLDLQLFLKNRHPLPSPTPSPESSLTPSLAFLSSSQSRPDGISIKR
ncbi:hypothetical protein SISNIDRAFT_413500 [Sistotremastrum niveocremeum HHB9708]|uniref:Golgi apparatus membrane protein TVP38 n=1 Tax=Sistotremastrum niveocremeum HHB9708 TaxID=1314777 RepID=A0A164SZ27_9AGAM|nr:hypothetical protein SISNIDRAFT_413500 [Sistotremastrum niveocremeum HHB9708]